MAVDRLVSQRDWRLHERRRRSVAFVQHPLETLTLLGLVDELQANIRVVLQASADPGQTRLDAMDVIAALASRFTVTRSMGTRGVRQVWSLLRLLRAADPAQPEQLAPVLTALTTIMCQMGPTWRAIHPQVARACAELLTPSAALRRTSLASPSMEVWAWM